MPFTSRKQEKFMWMKHPEIAKKWEAKYGSFKKHKLFKAKTYAKALKSHFGLT
jgi:hypothetical protein